MSDDAKAVQAKVDLMARVFIGRLPVRYEKMNEALALCRADPDDTASWTELHRLLHSLAGAAGTFGCDDLGEKAGLIELLLEDMLAQKTRSAADVDEVAGLLAIMQSST
jgi:chemotaxis protein histidine kinase CheA